MQILSFTGPSNSGKTWTIEVLVRTWKEQGLRVGVLKHCPKGYQLDREGKDSDRVFGAGADVVAVASPTECAVRYKETAPVDPLALIARSFPPDLDVVVLEGFREVDVPKIRVLERHEATTVPGREDQVVALIHPTAFGGADVPVFRPGDGRALAQFLAGRLGIGRARADGAKCASEHGRDTVQRPWAGSEA